MKPSTVRSAGPLLGTLVGVMTTRALVALSGSEAGRAAVADGTPWTWLCGGWPLGVLVLTIGALAYLGKVRTARALSVLPLLGACVGSYVAIRRARSAAEHILDATQHAALLDAGRAEAWWIAGLLFPTALALTAGTFLGTTRRWRADVELAGDVS